MQGDSTWSSHFITDIDNLQA